LNGLITTSAISAKYVLSLHPLVRPLESRLSLQNDNSHNKEPELGLIAREWVHLGFVDPFTTVVNSQNHMFLALGAENKSEQYLDEGEVLEVSLPKTPSATCQ
jgi:hypothetical protein